MRKISSVLPVVPIQCRYVTDGHTHGDSTHGASIACAVKRLINFIWQQVLIISVAMIKCTVMIARVRIAAAANFYPSHSQVGISVHPRLIHGSLGQYLSPHFKRHLRRSSRFCRAHPFYPTPPEVFGTPVHCRAER